MFDCDLIEKRTIKYVERCPALHSPGKFTLFGFVAGERRTGRHAIENVVHFLPVNPLGAGRDALARVRRGNLRRKGDRHDLVHAHLFPLGFKT
jgi:hypothetical protein